MARKALGKGIASLIKETPQEILSKSLKEDVAPKVQAPAVPTEETSPYMISVTEITPNPNQPRRIFKSADLQELTASVKENGILQPLIVTKAEGKGFVLIAGERRLRAAKNAGLEKVPAVIRKVTDRESLIFAILENVQRSDLNCIEEALAYYQLMDDFKLTQEEVAKKLGKERSTVANFLRLLKLPKQVLELLQKEFLTFGHGKVLAGVDKDVALRMANKCVTEKLSVRELEKLVKAEGKPNKPTVEKARDERYDSLRQKLEQSTGFHFKLKAKKNGAGEFVINFSNDAEFNDIFEYLVRR
jgi:ParB family chromosome partitioning protein